MKTFDPETEARLAVHAARREEVMRDVLAAYSAWCKRQGFRCRRTDLDEMINRRFNVTGGMSALSFESARTVIEGLRKNLK